jgi:hypothetical protein
MATGAHGTTGILASCVARDYDPGLIRQASPILGASSLNSILVCPTPSSAPGSVGFLPCVGVPCQRVILDR